MAINRTPVLKRCRSLDMNPAFLGISKTSHRKNARANRKVSEYGLQLREKQKSVFTNFSVCSCGLSVRCLADSKESRIHVK